MRELARAVGALGLASGWGADLEAEKKTVDLATVEMIQVRKPAG
jgi:hypothetical protein